MNILCFIQRSCSIYSRMAVVCGAQYLTTFGQLDPLREWQFLRAGRRLLLAQSLHELIMWGRRISISKGFVDDLENGLCSICLLTRYAVLFFVVVRVVLKHGHSDLLRDRIGSMALAITLKLDPQGSTTRL